MHERTLEMLGELFALERGAEIFTRDGRTLREGELLDQPGLVQTLEALADEGAASVYRGSIAEALLQVDGVVLDAEDLASYRPVWREPLIVEYQGRRVATRGGLSGVPELLPRLPRVGELTPTERVLALVDAFDAQPDRWRAHDEHGRRRLARPRVRAHALPRGGRGGLGAWLRHAVEQPPRRVGHRVRRPAAGRPSREPDGPVARLRRERPRARDRLRRRDPLANGARDGARRDPRRGARRRDGSGPPARSPDCRRRRCRARCRRGGARSARGERQSRSPLGSHPPLLRRRQLRRACRRSGRPAPQWRCASLRSYFRSSLSMRRDESDRADDAHRQSSRRR